MYYSLNLLVESDRFQKDGIYRILLDPTILNQILYCLVGWGDGFPYLARKAMVSFVTSENSLMVIQATVYERFLGKTLQELNRMAGIFRPFTRAKSREAFPAGKGSCLLFFSMVPEKKGGIGDIYI